MEEAVKRDRDARRLTVERTFDGEAPERRRMNERKRTLRDGFLFRCVTHIEPLVGNPSQERNSLRALLGGLLARGG